MACFKPNCSFNYDRTSMPPALRANPDISGIGVVVGFVGTGYITLFVLTLRYWIGPIKGSRHNPFEQNPVDDVFLGWVWHRIGRPPEKYGRPLKTVILTLSDTQVVTGIAILASGYSQINCGISIFHWETIAFLAWFSSATHLTTLTFLRQYVQERRGVKQLRYILMIILLVMLSVALILTGGGCGMGQTRFEFPAFFPGAPAQCCFELLGISELFGPDGEVLPGMLMSQVILFYGSISRFIKLSPHGSSFAREWLRHKPGRICKRFVLRTEKTLQENTLTLNGFILRVLTGTMVTFLVVVKAILDLVNSLVWEIYWLAFSLAWGTVRLLRVREIALKDQAGGSAGSNVALEEDSWGFGQWMPTLLLALPLIGLFEGYYSDKSIFGESLYNHGSPQASHRRSRTLSSIEMSSFADQTSISLPSSSHKRHQSNDSWHRQWSPEASSTDLQPIRPTFTHSSTSSTQFLLSPTTSFPTNSIDQSSSFPLYNQNFHTKTWYHQLLICIYLYTLSCGILIIQSLRVIHLFNIFSLISIAFASLNFFLYTSIFLALEGKPEKINNWFSCVRPKRRERVLVVFRWGTMVVFLLVLAMRFGPVSFFGLDLSMCFAGLNYCLLGTVVGLSRAMRRVRRA